jgi:hypothetical protein
MPLPTERISLNQHENSILRAGLDRILNEFAGLSRRVSRDGIDPALQHKFQPRYLAPGSYESILSLRNRLMANGKEKRGKYRFNAVEYAMLAFAARWARRLGNVPIPGKLMTKLEVYRERAKRRAITRCGQPAYKTAEQDWLCSSRWIRFNLLPLPSQRVSWSPRRLYREQRDSLSGFATEVMSERCTEPPSEEMLHKFIDLAVADIRHGRHAGVTVRELVANPAEGKQFLFDFIKKRMEKQGLDLHLRPEYQPRCVRSAMLGERFKAAMVVQVSAPPLEAQTRTSVPTVTVPVAVHPLSSRAPQSPATASETQVSVDDRCEAPTITPAEPRLTAKSVGDWLIKYLERDYWEDVIAEAHLQLPRRRINSQLSAATTIEAVQQACRPATESGDVTDAINSAVDWLADWVLVLETNRARIHQILGAGLSVAKSTYKTAPVRRPTMNGFRRLEEIMKGNLNPEP